MQLWSGYALPTPHQNRKAPRSAKPGRNPLNFRGALSRQPEPALSLGQIQPPPRLSVSKNSNRNRLPYGNFRSPHAVTSPIAEPICCDKKHPRQDRNRRRALRVGPRSSSTDAELSEHEADRGEAEKSECISGEIFEILGQPAASVQPGEGAFDNPPSGQNCEALSNMMS